MRDRGAVTVEAAFAMVALVLVVGLVLAGGAAAVDQIRCVDAAREAARLAARGDPGRARTAAAELAPAGADISIGVAGDAVDVRVRVAGPLPGIALSAGARAVLEPGVGQGGADGLPP